LIMCFNINTYTDKPF